MVESENNLELIKMKKIILIVTLFLTALSVHAEKIQLEGKDGFKIYGDYTAAKIMTHKGVIMLHQCNAERSMYQGLAQSLAANNISSMSLDFRGFGDSVTNEISLKALREKATSRENYFEMTNKLGIGTHRIDDVEIAYQYLLGKLGDQANISVIGASCGGAQALNLAKNHKMSSFIFFSSGMNERNSQLFHELSETPALIIAAQEDEFTFNSANEIFKGAKNDQSRLLLYKGAGHGLPLFKQDPNLENVMVEWFKLSLK